MARSLAPATLLGALLAVAVCGSESGAQQAPPAYGPTAGVVPLLRPVAELSLAGVAGQVDSGLGIYPGLASTDRLAFPGADAVASARRFARDRQGEVAFAVIDDRGGLRGLDVHRPFLSASLSKAMLLVAYLRKLAAENTELSESDLLTLGYMIRLSDNASADTIYARVGDARLRKLARRAGMKGFAIGGDWANATVTPAGQARFFSSIDRLVAPRFRDLTRDLLGSIIEAQSWGIPAGAGPAWRVFFKGGWRPEAEGELVHQAALLARGSRRVGIAVMTTTGPTMVYGERSVQGVARRLLSGAPAALLAPATGASPMLRPPWALARGRVLGK